MGLAFLNATVKAGGVNSKNWIARAAADRMLHTKAGTAVLEKRKDKPAAVKAD